MLKQLERWHHRSLQTSKTQYLQCFTLINYRTKSANNKRLRKTRYAVFGMVVAGCWQINRLQRVGIVLVQERLRTMACMKSLSYGIRSAQRWLVFITILCAMTGSAHAGTSTWTGSVSTDWGTAGNWGPVGVPTLGTDVVIPTGPTGGRFPTISSGTYDLSKDKLQIESGATLTQTGGTLAIKDLVIAAGGSYNQINGLLQIYHDWKNSGTFNSTGGTVQWKASGGHGASFASGANQFFNLIVDSDADPKFDQSANSSILIAGNYTNNNSSLDISQKATFTFNGSGDQTIYTAAGSANPTFGYLEVNTLTEAVSLTSDILIKRDVTVISGRLDLATYSMAPESAGRTLAVSSGGTLTIDGTSTFPTGFATVTLDPGSTVEYAGMNQTIAALTYSNLAVSGSGTKTLGGATTVNDALSLQGSAAFSLGGNTLTYASLADIEYKGSVPQTTGPEFPSSVPSGQRVIIDNANGVTLDASRTINGAFVLTAGNLTTGPSTLTIGSSTELLGSLTRTNGIIIGNVKRWFPAATVSDVLFPVGTSSNYRPANATFTAAPSAGGTLAVTFVASDPGANGLPLDDGGFSVTSCGKQGYWVCTAGDGLTGTYSLDLTADGFEAVSDYTTLRILKRANSASPWTLDGTHATGTGSNETPTVHRTGLSGFSEFGIGGGPVNPLPVQLAGFSGRSVGVNSVLLEWSTVSEVNNYGFYVQRRLEQENEFGDLPNGFVAGHGTTLEPQHYSFADARATEGVRFYRLRQVDLDGSMHYSEPLRVDLVTGVEDHAIPSAFALEQNYPNPFNPTTIIQYSLPASAHVTLKLYNLLGQEVMTLVDGVREAGVQSATLSASDLTSGMYLYKIQAVSFVRTKRLTVLK
jgi:hypothetical protein